MQRSISRVSIAFFLMTGCQQVRDPESHDHEVENVVIEGDAITRDVGSDRASKPFDVERRFERLGIMWDAPKDTALEIRTSVDGTTWSDWTKPEIFFSEEGAYAGRVDVPSGARYYQYRVSDEAAPPTFIDFEPLAEIPPPIETDAEWLDPEYQAEDVEESDADLEALGFEDPADGDEESPELPMTEEDDSGVATGASGLTTRIGSVRVHSRNAWGARSPRCALASQSPNRVTVHHTVTPTNDSMSPQSRLRQIQSFHMFSNGWCDIGYNFIVSRDGRVWRGRGARRVGAHTEGSNTGNVGISFLGTYSSTGITSRQMCNSARLVRYLAGRYAPIDLTRRDVKGHRQYNSTSCPGDKLYRQLDALVSTARRGCR
jgi:hypothetical protein